jgi:two-component system, cell cycle sensor histidine kinase and response regulator CckA
MLAPAVPATILVVDDLDMIRRLLTRMLTLAGYTVLEAADGHEALALLRRHDQPVDLLLTDVLMPGMNGTELAARVLHEFAGTRVMLMSAYLPEGTATVGRLGQSVRLMQKPIDWHELARIVSAVLAESAPVI